MIPLKIEMIHDVVCSWCPIGYYNLKQALRNLNTEAEIHFLPRELNPDMRPEGEEIDAHLARRYQWSQSKLRGYRSHLLEVSKQAGVDIDFSRRTHYYNSNKAHRLMHWAERENKQEPMNELLIDAYFKRGLDINNTAILLDLAEQIGLDRQSAEKALTSETVYRQLVNKQRRVDALGVSSIPAFIFNESDLVSGSNSVEYFESKIRVLTGSAEPRETVAT